MRNKSRILKIIAALAVACVYIFVFGIIQVVNVSADNSHKIDVNVPVYTTATEKPARTTPPETDKPESSPSRTEEQTEQTEPKETQRNESVADLEAEQTPPPETDAPAWKETAYSAVMTVNTDGIYSRARAELGAETVNIYYAGDRVNVVAWTDTEYYKLEDGNFIHSAYLDAAGGDTNNNSIPNNDSGGDNSGGNNSGGNNSGGNNSGGNGSGGDNSGGNSSGGNNSGGNSSGGNNSGGNSSGGNNSGGNSSGGDNSGGDNSGGDNSGGDNSGDTLTIYDQNSGRNVTADAYEIVVRTVVNELGTTWPDEAVKAQAVAAYTHIKKENLSGNTPTVGLQPLSSATDRIMNLVDEVFGEGIYYGGELINCSYFASSCGYTNSAENEWGGYLPYLVSVDCPLDAADPNYGIKTTFTAAQVKSIISDSHGITLTGNKKNWIKVNDTLDQRANGWVTSVSVGGADFHGKTLREDFSLPSEAFTVTYDSGTDKFTFTTYGYGHGVGMSQNGAKMLADNGYSYKEILQYYYTGVTVG